MRSAGIAGARLERSQVGHLFALVAGRVGRNLLGLSTQRGFQGKKGQWFGRTQIGSAVQFTWRKEPLLRPEVLAEGIVRDGPAQIQIAPVSGGTEDLHQWKDEEGI